MTISEELEELAAFSETSTPSITRVVFSPEDQAARRWLKTKFAAAGLQVREDAIGNTFARWPGTDAAAPAVATGSHIDAIPNSGRFDGTVGVLGGLEAIRRLQAQGFVPRCSIELILFTAEEPTRFAVGCFGSRMMSGVLSADQAAQFPNIEGLRSASGFKGPLESVRVHPGQYSAFVELHIEQGPLLEQHQLDIGVVTSIAAPAAMKITVNGSGGHAGTVLMRDRRDAFVAAAEMAIAVEAIALATGSPDSVATTGICHVFPGAVNSVPSQVKLELDVRDADLARRDRMLEDIKQQCGVIAERRSVNAAIEMVNADAPAACNPLIVQQIADACAQLGLRYQRMVSRAYHDALFMSRLAPASMIFIPCREGFSHRPEEFASERDISNGVAVLTKTLAALAS